MSRNFQFYCLFILFFAVLAIASAQRRVERPSRRLYRLPVHRYRLADDDQHFASLGGADVGRYSREQYTRRGWGRFGDYQETKVSGVSLGKAKVGTVLPRSDRGTVTDKS
ncbi:hypothetical protein TNCT_113141 [Trichonephila clavata]|uniref:Secreted protein n=1 Tax=Trichonephila clavata TaxID=2740835 RepID=A0A8X6HYD1_TRICU|nr:hypothetical protein TNCT_113141 [Trichonephila clavata]